MNLRAADIDNRAGSFEESADALYYRAFFTPDLGTPGMSSDVLDVGKLADHWDARAGDAKRVLGPAYAALADRVHAVELTATDEYFCHEAGHATGWGVESKYQRGYFTIRGTTAWALVFVEEFRADMQSLGFALETLPRDRATAIFAYHLVHRFGLAARAARTGSEGAGAVPYLLFCLLLDIDFLRPEARAQIKVPAERLTNAGLTMAMRDCTAHAIEELTRLELDGAPPVDIALNAGSYYRRRALDTANAELYAAWLRAGAM